MAVSAFKSTTRRECVIGAGNESDIGYSGAVPLLPSTPDKMRVHRRTQSFADLSAPYHLSSNDANSKDLDSLFQQGKRASSRYQSDCDSESDADSTYSRHTYSSLQNAGLGAARKAFLQNRTPKKEDKRRSPGVERSYKEIADFLSCIDDPNDADAEAPPKRGPSPARRRAFVPPSASPGSVFSRLAQPRRSTIDAQSEAESLYSQFDRARRNLDAQSDTESGFSRPTQRPQFDRARRNLEAQSDTESGFSRPLQRPRRRIDAQSDTEDVFSRLAQPRRRIDAQSDSEDVFSRLARPRQALGPPRTGANNSHNGKAKGTRAGAFRRSTSELDLSTSFRSREIGHIETESLYSNRKSRQTPSYGQSSSGAGRKKGTRAAALRRSTTQVDFSDNASLEGFRLPASYALDAEESPDEAFFEEFIYKQQMGHDFPPAEEDTPSGHPEEEKTIRAVHTQNKEPRAQELDAISLYDAMRAEMRKAVSEIRSEIEQKSVSKELVVATPSVEEGLHVPIPKEYDDEDMVVTEVRREYASKLEQRAFSGDMGNHAQRSNRKMGRKKVSTIHSRLIASGVSRRLHLTYPGAQIVSLTWVFSPEPSPWIEKPRSPEIPARMLEVVGHDSFLISSKVVLSEKRAQDLWTQLASEERRCLELVKFVKELLPAQTGAALQPRAPPPPPSRPIMSPEAEQQLVSQCLDADAQRYFDECVSLAGLDMLSINDASSCGAGAGYQESECGWSVKDMPLSPKKNLGRLNEKNVAVLQSLKLFCAQIEQNGKCIGKSSTFLTRAPISEDGLVLPWLQWETKMDKSGSSSSSICSKALGSNQCRSWSEKSSQTNEEQEAQPFDLPPGISGLGCIGNSDLSTWKNMEFGLVSHLHSRNVVDVEMFVLERSLLRCRILGGRIHICGGVRW